MTLRKQSPRAVRLAVLLCASCTVGFLLPTGTAQAGERQFLVILATSPKDFGGGQPPEGLVNPELIEREYFDKDFCSVSNNISCLTDANCPSGESCLRDGIDSFSEYWEEISYGDVVPRSLESRRRDAAGIGSLPARLQRPCHAGRLARFGSSNLHFQRTWRRRSVRTRAPPGRRNRDLDGA